MDINWADLLRQYGYLAVFVGTFLEGESILVAGALAAHGGFLNLGGVLGSALGGSFLADQIFFQLGRRLGRPWLEKRPGWMRRAQRVYLLLDRHDAAFILGFRFLYGLRTVSPFVVGTSTLGAPRFFLLNFCGALLWVLLVGGLGYFAGDAWAKVPPGTLTGPRLVVAVGTTAVFAGLGLWVLRWRRRRLRPPA